MSGASHVDLAQARAIANSFELGAVRAVTPTGLGANRNNTFVDTAAGRWVVRVQRSGEPDRLRRERFFVNLIHAHSSLPVPWPYRVDSSGTILGEAFAVMPRLSGEPPGAEPATEWGAVGTALAAAAIELHGIPLAGQAIWDAEHDDLIPSPLSATTAASARAEAVRDRRPSRGMGGRPSVRL